MKLKNNPDSTNLSEAVKEYTIPAQHKVDGVSVPVSLVAEVAPDTSPLLLVPRMSWIYQARRVAVQGNAAGGAVRIDVQLNPGQIARVISATMANSGTNSAVINILDEDNAISATGVVVASAAATLGSIPRTFTATTTGLQITTDGLILASGQKLAFDQSVAGIQADTMTVAIVLELFNVNDIPIWSVARSTNPADVVLAASTISEANTITTGRIW